MRHLNKDTLYKLTSKVEGSIHRAEPFKITDVGELLALQEALRLLYILLQNGQINIDDSAETPLVLNLQMATIGKNIKHFAVEPEELEKCGYALGKFLDMFGPKDPIRKKRKLNGYKKEDDNYSVIDM